MYRYTCEVGFYESDSWIGLLWEILKHRLEHLRRDGIWMDGYEEILPEIIKVLTKKSFEANKKYPGIIADPQSFAFQVANELGGLNPNQQKVGGHVRNFDIEKKTFHLKTLPPLRLF